MGSTWKYSIGIWMWFQREYLMGCIPWHIKWATSWYLENGDPPNSKFTVSNVITNYNEPGRQTPFFVDGVDITFDFVVVVNHEPLTIKTEPWTIDHKTWSRKHAPWTMKHETWTMNHWPLTMSRKPCTMNYQQLTMDH